MDPRTAEAVRAQMREWGLRDERILASLTGGDEGIDCGAVHAAVRQCSIHLQREQVGGLCACVHPAVCADASMRPRAQAREHALPHPPHAQAQLAEMERQAAEYDAEGEHQPPTFLHLCVLCVCTSAHDPGLCPMLSYSTAHT